jgi:hypothetical protein
LNIQFRETSTLLWGAKNSKKESVLAENDKVTKIKEKLYSSSLELNKSKKDVKLRSLCFLFTDKKKINGKL